MPRPIDRCDPSRSPGVLEQHVERREPVVVTGLFAGQPLDGIRTLAAAVDAWGEVAIQVQEEYASAEGHGDAPLATMSIGEYARLTRTDPGTRLCCTEYDTPVRVLASFELPALCAASRAPVDPEVFDLPRKYGDLDLVSNTFVANAGNVAHLHFDGDQREVLLHQVYGRKRIVLLPPGAAAHLRTLDGPSSRPSLAGVYLEDMGSAEQADLIDRAGGWETVLEPGETLYIPMLLWHHIEYLDDAMSFNLRFGRTPIGRFLCLDNFHRDPFIQNAAWALGRSDTPPATREQEVEAIKATYLQPADTPIAKVGQVRARFRDLVTRLCPDVDDRELCPPEREGEQVARIVASRDMVGLKYADPAVLGRGRPVGPISDRQREVVLQSTAERGWSDEVRQAVLRNRFGKRTVDELTKIEAAQVLAYLTTPGAAW